MSPETQPVPKWMLWTGWILSGLVTVLMLTSGVMKLAGLAFVLEEFTRLGWPEGLVLGLGIVEVACAVVYVIPQTSILGAILLTGYFGGAIATHVRIHDPYIAQIVLGVVLWCGLWLRDSRVRALLPLRSCC